MLSLSKHEVPRARRQTSSFHAADERGERIRLVIELKRSADARKVTRAIKLELSEKFGIGHSTVEIVWGDETACALEIHRSAVEGHGS